MANQTLQLLARKTGVVLLQSNTQPEPELTETLQQQARLPSASLKSIAGLRPYTGMRITSERPLANVLVVTRHTIVKDDKPIWAIYDPLPLQLAMVSYPNFAFSLATANKLDGQWLLGVDITAVFQSRVPEKNPNAYFDQLQFQPAQIFRWEFVAVDTRLKPTGERIRPLEQIDTNVSISLEDI